MKFLKFIFVIIALSFSALAGAEQTKAINHNLCLTTNTKNPIAFKAEKVGRGCCSWHGGVSYCASNHRIVCNDATYSPSCRC